MSCTSPMGGPDALVRHREGYAPGHGSRPLQTLVAIEESVAGPMASGLEADKPPKG